MGSDCAIKIFNLISEVILEQSAVCRVKNRLKSGISEDNAPKL